MGCKELDMTDQLNNDKGTGSHPDPQNTSVDPEIRSSWVRMGSKSTESGGNVEGDLSTKVRRGRLSAGSSSLQ